MANEVRMDNMLRTTDDAINQRNEQKKSSNNSNSSRNRPKRYKKIGKVVGIITLVIVFLGLVGWGVYSYLEIEKMQSPTYVQQQAEQEKETLVEKISKLMELPDEEAVVATVTDKSKLADQPFFEKAEDGDKVLIFSESSLAVIYRESTNKIINSGPIAITSGEVE